MQVSCLWSALMGRYPSLDIQTTEAGLSLVWCQPESKADPCSGCLTCSTDVDFGLPVRLKLTTRRCRHALCQALGSLPVVLHTAGSCRSPYGLYLPPKAVVMCIIVTVMSAQPGLMLLQEMAAPAGSLTG